MKTNSETTEGESDWISDRAAVDAGVRGHDPALLIRENSLRCSLTKPSDNKHHIHCNSSHAPMLSFKMFISDIF